MQFSVSKHFSELFEALNRFSTAYLLYQTVFHLSRTFSKLFSKLLKQIFQKSNFLTAISFETAYLLYQTEIRLSRTFFVLFKLFFSSTAAPLGDIFIRITQVHSQSQALFSTKSIFILPYQTDHESRNRKGHTDCRQCAGNNIEYSCSFVRVSSCFLHFLPSFHCLLQKRLARFCGESFLLYCFMYFTSSALPEA